MRQGNWFKPCQTGRCWPGHDAAQTSYRLPGTWSQPAARVGLWSLLFCKNGLAKVKVSLLPAAWKQPSQTQQQGPLAGLYGDVIFLQLAAYVSVQGRLDGHHEDVLWKNNVRMQP